MSDRLSLPRSRVFTSWGTVLYFDQTTGRLRHGPVASSPENAFFVAEPSFSKTDSGGVLAQLKEGNLTEIARNSSPNELVSSVSSQKEEAEARFNLIHVERGLSGLEHEGTFVSAHPDGSVTRANWCSTWELLILAEDWCSPPNIGSTSSNTGPSINRRMIRSFIVDPRHRAVAKRNSRAKKILIYGYPQWSHGRVYYDLCKHLHERGYIVDILNWRLDHAAYIQDILAHYDLYMAALDGVRTLVDSYGAPYEKIIAVSHHELDMRMLIEQKGADVFEKFANYGVVSEFLYCASQMMGIRTVPQVASLGINFSEFQSEPPKRLEVVGYGSSMSVNTYGVEWKRGELAKAATEAAGLVFKVAGSTGDQISFHDMPEFYRSVDAVLNSSISEAAQLPVMEAAAAGRLVIGTPVGHFPRRAYQGGGILAPVEAEKFKTFTAKTLEYYKNNPSAFVDKCKSIQESARHFDWQYCIGEWIDLIENSQARWSSSFKAQEPASPGPQTSALGQIDAVVVVKACASQDLSDPSPLCTVMSTCGSDKAGPFHNYTIVYDRLFSQFRNTVLSVFELGLGTNKVGSPSSMGSSGVPGASLRGWHEYFPNAQVFGADVDADILFQDDRIKSFWVDQREPMAIRALWQSIGDVQFDIMIDDGLHEAWANLCFFSESFAKLKSGGIYIIEDITPGDTEEMQRFATAISSKAKGAVVQALPHARNNVDNRLVVIQKA